MLNHSELGTKGEEIAVKFLQKKGYKIIERNWRYKKKEIDIIALKDDVLVIAEVKCRSNDNLEDPYESVKRKKQKHLVEAADNYLIEKNLDLEARFDIISILYNGMGYTLEHIEDAFYPTIR